MRRHSGTDGARNEGEKGRGDAGAHQGSVFAVGGRGEGPVRGRQRGGVIQAVQEAGGQKILNSQ